MLSSLLACGVGLVVLNHVLKAEARVKTEVKYLPWDIDSFYRLSPQAGQVYSSMFEDPSITPYRKE